MRAQRGGLLGRCRSEAENGVGVARCVRVMREPCHVRPAGRRLGESCEGRAMEAQPTPRLNRLLDRQARELVAERDRARRRFDQHPRVQTFLQCGQIRRRPTSRAATAPPAAATIATASSSARASPLSRAARASTASRTVAGIPPFPEAQHLGHEEWVAGCDPVELARVDAVRLGELRDSLERERREWHPCEGEPRRHLAEHDPERDVSHPAPRRGSSGRSAHGPPLSGGRPA